jgi:hypothetical protein
MKAYNMKPFGKQEDAAARKQPQVQQLYGERLLMIHMQKINCPRQVVQGG